MWLKKKKYSSSKRCFKRIILTNFLCIWIFRSRWIFKWYFIKDLQLIIKPPCICPKQTQISHLCGVMVRDYGAGLLYFTWIVHIYVISHYSSVLQLEIFFNLIFLEDLKDRKDLLPCYIFGSYTAINLL